eukprot:CAMPEP_0197185262 /NCGR_PEP_ID=MMETSP1423-20130617/11562_1 /TAXON_ID=476441 /ORGANISM="Pseudo-nitzschia heimii, Strain UNC1101" /LENGTH=777 /DNA_ID=CAMNT_0042636283 /DNA_START=510 /DNA_END=2843 /DNA_ORIENTATION=+
MDETNCRKRKGNEILPPRPPQRAVARAVANLGNTCYINAVLQALAHAPELCMAMDVEGHRMCCPIYKENAEKMAARSASSSASSSRSSSPESSTTGNFYTNGELKSVYTYSASGAVATRKSSRRATRSSPTTDNEQKSTSDPNATKFCALCETEHHMDRVHRNSKNGRPTNTNGTSVTTGNSAGNKPVSPMDFVHGFIDQVAPSSFRVGQQEDAHEFLRLLIEAMQKSCKRARQLKTTAVDQGNPQDTPAEVTPAEAQSTSSNDDDCFLNTKPDENVDTEYPFQLFSGKIESNVTCGHCDMTSSTLDPIEDLGLDVTPIAGAALHAIGGRKNTPASVASTALADVSHALQRFACAEDLDAGYKCENCGQVGKATKQVRLASIPPILTLHLKRFRYGASDPSIANNGGGGFLGNGGNGYLPPRRSQRTSEVSQLIASSGGVNSGVGSDWYMGGKSGSAKIEGHVGFKPVMDLRPYLTEELQKKHGNMLCRLFAVVVHVGKNSHSGHYLAYVRNIAKNEWWKMDDARVSRVSTQEVLNSEAYMLFYRVVDHPYSKKLASQVKALNELHEATDAKKVKGEKAATLTTNVKTKKELIMIKRRNKNAAVVEENPDNSLSVVESHEPSTTDQSAVSSPAAAVKKNHRKRKAPKYTSGEEWARSMTVLTEKNIAKFPDVEHKVSKHIEFTPEFEKLLAESACMANAKVGHDPNSGVNLLDDCGIGSKEDINIALLRCFLAVSKNDDIVDFTAQRTPKMMTRSTAASPAKMQASIHVVDPTDDLL